jgi:aryl-alcohol dehydrogenase-like predicted oxidoreductase
MATSAASSRRLQNITWRDEDVSRIILGTVQLGLDYGVANVHGKPSPEKALKIMEAAWACGVRHFDTAQAYGDSEAVIGRALRDLAVAREARIASKLSPRLNPADPTAIADSIERTFEDLGVDRLWCMMLHVAGWLDYWDDGLGEVLTRYRSTGRILHLGVSLNSPSEAERCLRHPDMQILQVACSAWDRRMPLLGVMNRARENGRLCCVRSVYLKGLLVLSVEEVAARMPFAKEASMLWHDLARRYDFSPSEMAIRFAAGLDAPLVVGAETAEQIVDTARIVQKGPLDQEVIDAISTTLDPVLTETILTPRLWEDLEGVRLSPERS